MAGRSEISARMVEQSDTSVPAAGPVASRTVRAGDAQRSHFTVTGIRCSLWLAIAGGLLLAAGSGYAAELPRSDANAMAVTFGEVFLQQNARAVHQETDSLPLPRGYSDLADWVLPSRAHATFRLTGEFGSTNPSPPTGPSTARLDTELTSGVAVICPALELIDVARQLGKLDELREQVIATEVLPTDAQQQYVRATLLFLIEVARKDFAAATQAFDEVIAHSLNLDSKSPSTRWPSLLMLRAAIASSDADIRRHVTEYFFSLYQDLRNYSPNTELDVINDHLRALFALNQFLGKGGEFDSSSIELSDQWVPFGYSDARTRGHGRPTARWHSVAGSVEKLSGHEMDYLSFRSPLTGNYQVECDFSVDGGNYFSFMVGGSLVQAISNGASLRTGNFRKPYTDRPLDIPLTKFRSTARFRAVVRDGVMRHFLNGYEVHSKELPAQHNPWVTMRAWRRSLGSVRDFRITGEPVIPDEINLTGDPELSGWAPYFETGFGPEKGNWQATDDGAGGTGILGVYRPELAGASVQKLLRYCRPVVEDGTIEYDFYYKAGESCVHPALGRLSFILDPSGVKIHWITDRKFERFLRDPASVVEEPGNRLGPARLPLIEDSWNRIRLDVTGDTVHMTLNDQPIYQRKLEASNQRTFGLFHYADRTTARIRNVTWRGDWPKQLPALENQDLVDTRLLLLDESREQLAEHFHHDFRNDPLHERFDLVGNESRITPTESGLHQEMVGNTGTKQLKSGLRISGDFDITATFQDLEHVMDEPCWELRTGFILYFDNETRDACGIYRKLSRNKTNRRVALLHSSHPLDRPYTVRSDYAVEESTSGRLRMVRRGSTIYGLYAQDDSPNFRFIKKFEATNEPLLVQGFRLTFMSSKQASVAVTWNELDIRAEQISGLPPSDPEPVLEALNVQRESLPARTIDFVDLNSTVNSFAITASGTPELTPVPEGLRITNEAGDSVESSILISKVPLGQGSDVELKMDVHELGHPDVLATNSEIALKVFFGSSMQRSTSPHEATFILRQKSNGRRDLVTRILYRNNRNRTQYRPLLAVPVRSPDSFRVVVHEGLMYFLYSEADSEGYTIASTAPIAGELPATGVELKFVANGKEHKSDLTLKQLVVHGPEDGGDTD